MNVKKKYATQTAKRRLDKLEQSRLDLHKVAQDLPVREWEPLKAWPFSPHRRQADMGTYRKMPSQFQ